MDSTEDFRSAGGKDDDRVDIEGFHPVRIAPDEVFSLAAQGHNAERFHRRHIHGSLCGFRNRQHITANGFRQCVHGKYRKVVFIKRKGRFPDNGAGAVIGIRWDVPGLFTHLDIEPLFSDPDVLQLPILQWRNALLGGLQKQFL